MQKPGSPGTLAGLTHCIALWQIEKNKTKDIGAGGRGRGRGSARAGRGGSRSTNNSSNSTRAQGLTVSIRNSGVRKGRGTGVRRVSWCSTVCWDHSIRVRRLASSCWIFKTDGARCSRNNPGQRLPKCLDGWTSWTGPRAGPTTPFSRLRVLSAAGLQAAWALVQAPNCKSSRSCNSAALVVRPLEATRGRGQRSPPAAGASRGSRSPGKDTPAFSSSPLACVSLRVQVETSQLQLHAPSQQQAHKPHLLHQPQPGQLQSHPAQAPVASRCATRRNGDPLWPSQLPSQPPSQQLQAGADYALHRAVSNLDHNVSEQDLNELFSNVGPLHSCVMDFDAR